MLLYIFVGLISVNRVTFVTSINNHMWLQSFIDFGVVRVEGTRVLVYKDRVNRIAIETGRPVQMALWNGDELNVYMADGRIRRYKDRVNFVTIG